MRGTARLLAAATALAVTCSGAARAQYNNPQQQQLLQQQRQQYQQLPMADLKGTVEKVSADGVSIKCEGQAFFIKVEPNHTRVQCTGTAERGYLQSGLLVRFEGEFDRKMQAKAPIEEVSIVSPSETAQPGIHSDTLEEDESGRTRQRAATESYVVIGMIKLIKDNQMNVVADEKSIKVQLAKDAEVAVDVDDYSLAEAGDEITVKGRMLQPPQGPQAGQIIGEDVSIALANPVQSTTKAPAKKKKIKRAAR